MLTNRPPIVVILGHVDHGKTTLLDYLRKSHLTDKEVGGITQSIRSFQIPVKDYGLMTFIDTPGHEAFAKMRRRGSQMADLAVLIVAADDGVKPQTRECIEFIQNSHLPFVVAINKADLSTANPDQVKTQLTESGVIVEDFGGQVPVSTISAKTGKNIPELLELIHLLVSLNPPQADSQGKLDLIVLESHLDSKKGPLATVLVKNGTLNVGRDLFGSEKIGKVKSLLDPDGQIVKSAIPSQPVEVLGLTQVPEVGSNLSDSPVSQNRDSRHSPFLADKLSSGQNIILRADVAGSLEALLDHLASRVNIIASGTGDIIENDILLARTSNASVLGFNVRVSGSVSKLAETEKISVKTFPIIYELFDYVDELLSPKSEEKILGKATVIADFKIESDKIAGCRCTEGNIAKSDRIKILRGETLIGETRIKSLRQGKQSVDKIKSGIEFGAILSPYVDFKISDTIIAIG